MERPGDGIARAIAASGLTIYDDLSDRPELVYDIAALEARLTLHLAGANLDYPIRTRAKVAKTLVTEAMGYPVPASFRRAQPRFPGQNLDVSVQMSDNLQVWNEEIDPLRRYALIRVDAGNVVTRVRVLTGESIALFDTTGTLTSKFQAKRRSESTESKLVSGLDTETFRRVLDPSPSVGAERLASISPASRPTPGAVLPITSVWERLVRLVGVEFDDPGLVQERARGVVLQRIVCDALGLGPYADAGQFPDILSQALEVKFQLSPTIDLGLVSPDSVEHAEQAGYGLRHCDARYVVAYGSRIGDSRARIDAIVITTGADFFTEFQRFEGLVQNRKLQIPLPRDLFDGE